MGKRNRPPLSLEEAAGLHLLVQVKCNRRRRLVRYKASDLLDLFGPKRSALDPPFACSQCGLTDYLRADTYAPQLGDYGHLVIRRSDGVRKIQLWRNEVL